MYEKGSGVWLVPSADVKCVNKVQRSSEFNRNCVGETFQLMCKQCKICVPKMICTCPDFTIRATICKHIHVVARKLLLERDAAESSDALADYADGMEPCEEMANFTNLSAALPNPPGIRDIASIIQTASTSSTDIEHNRAEAVE